MGFGDRGRGRGGGGGGFRGGGRGGGGRGGGRPFQDYGPPQEVIGMPFKLATSYDTLKEIGLPFTLLP
jgi:hypothetical protein